VDAFFEWWETDLHRTLDELRVTGGEPLMSGYTWQLIDWFRDNPGRSQTRLAINSNLGMQWDVVERLLQSTNGIELDLYTSMESMQDHANYIRDGLDWDQWLYNMHRLMGSKKLRSLHVMCTINALCLESLVDFLDLMLEYKKTFGKDFPSFTLNILRFPSFQSALVLPKHIRQHHKEHIQSWLEKNRHNQGLHEHEINHVQRLIDYLDVVETPHSETFEMSKLHNDFQKFYQQYDQRRGKNFGSTFPRLKDWYDSL
jgi:hypothetical protein